MSRKATLVGLAIVSTLLVEIGSAQTPNNEIRGIPKPSTIAQLRSNANAFKNVFVRFTGQYMGLGTIHNPFFTRFTRADYVNFAMWGTTQRIWEQAEYGDPCGTLFVAKKVGEAMLEKLYGMQRYRRLECVGIVHHVFKGEPWIEVLSIDEISDRVNVTTLEHMARGRELMKARKWIRAATELNMAITGGLPDATIGWIHNYLGVCFMRTGKAKKAIRELKLAASYLQDEEEIASNLRLMRLDPKAGVDKKVLDGRVPRARRPMWEAYERSILEKKSNGSTTRTGSNSRE